MVWRLQSPGIIDAVFGCKEINIIFGGGRLREVFGVQWTTNLNQVSGYLHTQTIVIIVVSSEQTITPMETQ